MNIQVTCPQCGVFNRASDEKCWKCSRLISDEEKQSAISDHEEKLASNEEKRASEEEKNAEETRQLLLNARETGQWNDVPEHIIEKEASKILLTTSFMVAGRDIANEIDIITAEAVYGVNAFHDLFAGVRDIIGGRSKALQNVLKDARKAILLEMRKEALIIGADAVIAINLAYQEISGPKHGMLMLVGSGTAVNLKP